MYLVGAEHARAESFLVHPASHAGRDVPTAALIIDHVCGSEVPCRGVAQALDNQPRIVDFDVEEQRARIVADDEHGPDGKITAGDYAEEVDERDPGGHGAAEAGVIAMVEIGAAVGITQRAVWA